MSDTPTDEGWDAAAKVYLEADDALKEAFDLKERARKKLLALAEEDEGWDAAAKVYLEADDALKEATDLRKSARKKLLALAEEKDDPRGAGVSVSSSTREGRIDYKTMAYDLTPDLELVEKYRNPSYTVQTIRRTK